MAHKEIQNPFVISGYRGAHLFCDREKETEILRRNALNGANTTLISIRRLGKTGLIHHLFSSFEKEKKSPVCLFVDLYETQNLRDFANKFTSVIYRAFPEKETIGSRFRKLLLGMRPVFSFNSLTGEPEIQINYQPPHQPEQTIESLLRFLEQQNVQVLVAFDEFQQVANYPEQNAEATLRSVIQLLHNVNFIFSGSNKHLLAEIFGNAKRPFYASTQFLSLAAIERSKYADFIHRLFAEAERTIDAEAVDFILEWTRSHTFYTQMLCHRVYAKALKNNSLEAVKLVCKEILDEQEAIFMQYRNLLSPIQWSLLKAIAKEQKASSLSSSTFLTRYELTLSGSQRALKALLDKEMIYAETTAETTYYQVYNCFLGRWLETIN